MGDPAAPVKALVTGGGGFLGGALVRRLIADGHTVRSLSRGAYAGLDALGVQTLRGDLADPSAVRAAVTGCDVVFHVAAKAGIAGRARDFRSTNVLGTRNVLDACLAAGVPRLVFTSTPSVVHEGSDVAGADERLPYATRFSSPYPATKAVAERDVLRANGPALATVALRPHLIWGPGDTQLVARILDRARRGRLRYVGDGQALIDSTYIDNAVDAHLLAAGPAAAGLPPATSSVPYRVAYAAGAVAELAFRLLRPDADPPLTRFLVDQLATAHWFDISAARRDLGYSPAVSIEEGLTRLAASYGDGWAGGVGAPRRSAARPRSR